jgi:hypothetical protein
MTWNRTQPEEDGKYIVTTRYGVVDDMTFTTDGGWNTHRDGDKLMDQYAMNDGYIIGWMPFPLPMPNPDKIEFAVEWKGAEE